MKKRGGGKIIGTSEQEERDGVRCSTRFVYAESSDVPQGWVQEKRGEVETEDELPELALTL